jgi:hypothetical protein
MNNLSTSFLSVTSLYLLIVSVEIYFAPGHIQYKTHTHTRTHTHTHCLGLLWKRDRAILENLPDKTQHSKEIYFNIPNGNRPRNSKQAGGHWIDEDISFEM